MTQENKKNNQFIQFIVKYIKEEFSNQNVKTEIIKPVLIHILYYIIPYAILFILINFITTIIAVFIAFYFKKIYQN